MKKIINANKEEVVKIVIGKTVKETVTDNVIPTIGSLTSKITEEKIPEEKYEEIKNFFNEDVEHKCYKMYSDEEGYTTFEFKGEFICEALIIVSNLYKKFEPFISVIKNGIEMVTKIFGDYNKEVEEFAKKWDDEYEYTFVNVNNATSLFSDDSHAIIRRIKNSSWKTFDIQNAWYTSSELIENMDFNSKMKIFKNCVKAIIEENENDFEIFDSYAEAEEAYNKFSSKED